MDGSHGYVKDGEQRWAGGCGANVTALPQCPVSTAGRCTRNLQTLTVLIGGWRRPFSALDMLGFLLEWLGNHCLLILKCRVVQISLFPCPYLFGGKDHTENLNQYIFLIVQFLTFALHLTI